MYIFYNKHILKIVDTHTKHKFYMYKYRIKIHFHDVFFSKICIQDGKTYSDCILSFTKNADASLKGLWERKLTPISVLCSIILMILDKSHSQPNSIFLNWNSISCYRNFCMLTNTWRLS